MTVPADSEASLVRLALALGAARAGGPLFPDERRLAGAVAARPEPDPGQVAEARSAIQAGGDPLGAVFGRVRDAAARRGDGAVYTPGHLVGPMVDWTLDQRPARIVDAGAGSGRFLAAVLRREPGLEVIAVDRDPLATLMTRSMLAVLEASQARVIQADYTTVTLLREPAAATAFLGQPQAVRPPSSAQCRRQGLGAAGRRKHRSPHQRSRWPARLLLPWPPRSWAYLGEVGCFVTSAEWMDVIYGAIMRSLVLGPLGGRSLHIIEPKALPLECVQTTAVITAFEIGSQDDPVRLQDVESPGQLRDLATAGAAGPAPAAPGVLPLGRPAPAWDGPPRRASSSWASCKARSDRGAVTGANAFWVVRHQGSLRLPTGAVSVGHQGLGLFAAGPVLEALAGSTCAWSWTSWSELDQLDAYGDRVRCPASIKAAKQAGVDKWDIAAHRRAWWSVAWRHRRRSWPPTWPGAPGLRHQRRLRPGTSMIAHGFYPRQELDRHTLSRLAEALRIGTAPRARGRVYARAD